ncbi:unnamed protein product [Alopecurus aequalis]
MGIGDGTKRKFSPGSPHAASAKRAKKHRLRISSLPKDILSSITSKLPLREAARTSILSSQWRRIWLCRADINLCRYTVLSQSDRAQSWSARESRLSRRSKFINSVGALLRQHEGVGTENIRICYDLCHTYAAHIDKWVEYTVASKAKGLTLELGSAQFGHEVVRYDFPLHMLGTKNYSNLRCLELSFVSLSPPAGFRGFQNLTNLCLRDVNITNEDLQHLLSEGNRLECLRISGSNMLTSLRIPRCLNHLKLLLVFYCPLLQDIAVDCGVPALHYKGQLIRLQLAAPFKLRNLWSDLSGRHSDLGFIFSQLPTTIPHLGMLILRCSQSEMADLVSRLPSFLSLRHLILYMTITDRPRRTIDILNLGYILEATPFVEKLELHMLMDCLYKPYCHEDGKLRSLPSCPHSHLSLVNISGFIGEKDQLELALYILRNATVLKTLKIDPKPRILGPVGDRVRSADRVANGCSVALEFLAKSDHRNVVEVVGALI